jgi:hypothetical protein
LATKKDFFRASNANTTAIYANSSEFSPDPCHCFDEHSGRWWEDNKAAFHSRMPLEPHEEAVLQCIHQYSKDGIIKPFQDRLGHWRPDISLTDCESSVSGTYPKICEINSRGFLNIILTHAYGHGAMGEMTKHSHKLGPVSAASCMVDDLFTLFDPKLPIHLLRGEDELSSSVVFDDLVERRLGMRPRIVKPSDLRVLPDVDSDTGYSLYCLCRKQVPEPIRRDEDGEPLELIYQAGLQLFHH